MCHDPFARRKEHSIFHFFFRRFYVFEMFIGISLVVVNNKDVGEASYFTFLNASAAGALERDFPFFCFYLFIIIISFFRCVVCRG